MRYMADSVDCHQIPPSIAVPGIGVEPIVLRAGYAPSSRYHGSSFACGTPDVVIDVSGAYPASDVLDVERGDATPDEVPGWVQRHNAADTGYPGIIYSNRSELTAIANACAAAGLIPGRDYRWWIATLDGTQRVADMTGVTAVQVWGAGSFPGHNIDLSMVYDDAWKGHVPVPTPTPPGPPPPPPPAPGFDVRNWRVQYGQNDPHLPDLWAWANRMYPAYRSTPITWAPGVEHYGPQTAAFVKEFQGRVGIVGGDGMNIGPQTAAALYAQGFRG